MSEIFFIEFEVVALKSHIRSLDPVSSRSASYHAYFPVTPDIINDVLQKHITLMIKSADSETD